jgi:hypothetical protein
MKFFIGFAPIAFLALGCSQNKPTVQKDPAPNSSVPLLAKLPSHQLDSVQVEGWRGLVPPQQWASMSLEDRNRFFQQQVLNWGDAHILRSQHFMSPEDSLRLQVGNERLLFSELAQDWYQFHFQENFGLDEQVLKAYHNSARAKIGDAPEDSLFKIAILQDNDFLKYFEKNKYNWKKPSQYELSLIVCLNQECADSVKIGLKKNKSFEELAKKFSKEDESAPNGGLYGWFYPGIDVGPMRPHVSWLADTLFKSANTMVGKIFPLTSDGGKRTTFVRVNQYEPEQIPELKDVQDFAVIQFQNELRQKNLKNQQETLKQQNSIQMVQRTDDEVKNIYNASKQKILSPKAWKLKQIAYVDSLSAHKDLQKVLDGKASWEQLASQKIRGVTGYWNQRDLGWVKKGHAITYGLQFQDIQSHLESVQSRGVLGVLIRSSKYWHILQVDSIREATEKPWDRISTFVKTQVETSWGLLDDTSTIVSKNNEPWIREKDLKQYIEQIPQRQRSQYSRKRALDQVLNQKLLVLQAQLNGFDKSPRFALKSEQLRNYVESDFWRQNLGQNHVFRQGQTSTNRDSIKTALVLNSIPRSLLNVWHRAQLDTGDRAYQLQLNSTQLDSLAQVIYARNNRMFQEIYLWNLRSKAKLELRGSMRSPMQSKPEQLAQDCRELKSKQLHYKCETMLTQYLYAHPEQAGSDSLWFQLGQTWLEMKKYKEATMAFGAVDLLWPKAPSHSKALFMHGFVRMEHLRQDSAAIRSFQKMLDHYPNSELADDAEFLIKDLRSGRKLTEEMLKRLQQNP